jgi:phospholipid transport system substrate-binding protein
MVVMRAMRRRSGWTAIIARLCLALAFAVGPFARAAPAYAATPQDTVRSFYATLLMTMKQGPALGEGGRYAALAPVVPQVFDVPFMTRLAVGPDWASLTPDQQQQVTAAFGRYVAATYADRFDSYSGEQLEVGAEQPFAGGYIVRTRIVKPTGDPVTIDYLMRDDQGVWKIADVYLDGSISQLATQRSEFHAILRRKGVEGLISALNQKVDLLRRRSAENSP